MNQKIRRSRHLLPALAFAAVASTAYLQGWVDNGHKWPVNAVSYYVNPQSIYVSASAAISAIQTAAAGWSDQTHANIRLNYAGTTSGSSLVLNNKNEVFFRNTSGGGNVAETYVWWDASGRLVDADIVMYEGSYQFFAFSGCSGGVYVEDVTIHEFGHALGLGHSSVPNATMEPSMPGYCDLQQLTLESDDITGIETLYPPVSGGGGGGSGGGSGTLTAPSQLSVVQGSSSPSTSLTLSWQDNSTSESGFKIERSAGGGFSQVATVGANVTSYTDTGLSANTAYDYRVAAYNSTTTSSYSNIGSGRTASATQSNTAPTVTLTAPANNASYPEGAAITFSGSASDSQDGSMTASLLWTSSLSGSIGSGGSFSRTLVAGTHVITARVTDSGGLSSSQQVTVTVTAATGQTPTPPSQLTASSAVASPSSTIALSWQDNSTNETGFKIERSNGGAFTQVATVGANVTSYLDTGLSSNTAYDYRVAAYNGAGTSSYSNIGSGRTTAGTSNSAPTITITSPANNSSYASGVAIPFNATASDVQDGNLTSSIRWTSSLSGLLGTGGSLSTALLNGTHVITASVTDSGGLTSTAQVTVVVSLSALPPSPPSQLSASQGPSPSSSIALAWQDNSGNETGFTIERSNGGPFAPITQVGANVTSYTDTGLSPNTYYDYRVAAYNSSGTSSYSNIGSGRTAAGAVTNSAPSVTISSPANNSSFAEGTTINFSGTASDNEDGNLTGNLLWTSSISGAIGTGGSVSRSLTAGTHVITASVSDSGSLSASKQITITVTGTGTPPAPPSQLTASAGAASPATTMALAWLDNSGNEAGFRIERSDGGPFTSVAQVGANVRTYLDTGLSPSTYYDYRVAAYNSAGWSAYSNIGSGRTDAGSPNNTPPTVTIVAPADGTSFSVDALITFSASAFDSQDGTVAGTLQWSSDLIGSLGSGSVFATTLPAGVHVITARATDSGGLSGSAQITISIGGSSQSQPASPVLTVRAYKVKQLTKADLTWTGLSGSTVDVIRNGTKIATVPNSGFMTDPINTRGTGTFVYSVCVAGTSTCTNEASAVF